MTEGLDSALIDLVGYRRHGHNEGDEPSFTQPVMYKAVGTHPTVREIFADTLIKQGSQTPESADAHVKNHFTKLETIYDRIHEIRWRFEVMKRDAEIEYLKAVMRGDVVADAKTKYEAELKQLDDDFAFVGECNVGGEFMAPEKVERLKKIAERTLTRTLSDRVGISYDEAKRKKAIP